ncbi:MAG: porin [Phycisphaerales bacterium]
MSHTKSIVLLAGAAFGLSGAAFADQSAWSNQNADEVRALVAEMMNDAQTRSSLLQSGATAGHDGKFFLGSADGNFRLNVGGQIQFRYLANFRDDNFANDPATQRDESDDDNTLGFQTRRTKLWFEGHIFDPNLYYKVQGAFERNGGDFILEDAYVGYKFENGLDLRWGQFKSPFLREELVSSSRQLTVDRSNVNEFFNQDRSQGVQVAWEGEQFRAAGMFSDGFRSANTDFNADPADFALTGRVEFLAMGDWSQFRDFTSWRGSSNALMIGGAIHWESDSEEINNVVDDFFAYTLDASWESDGWNLYGAFVGSETNSDLPGGDLSPWGFVLQGGVFVAEDWELFARYDYTDGDTLDEFSEITFGVNYYIHKHAAKFTADVVWALDETATAAGTAAVTSTGTGLLASGEQDQFVIRAQFQLVF